MTSAIIKFFDGNWALAASFSLIAVLFIVAIAVALGFAMQSPPVPAFSVDVRSVVEQCAESNTSTHSSIINGQAFSSKSVNADGLLRCLYSNEITINFHGDLVRMDSTE